MTDSVVAEGHAKMRDGKKWRSRWVALRKPSPVADCLVLLAYKERGVKERNCVVLEHICGLEVGECEDGVAFTLTILCLTTTAQLGFDSKEALLSWDQRLRYCLGEVHSFNVMVLPGTKLECGPATLHLCNHLLAIARDHPPVITGQWNVLDLRRYGPVTNGFVFEGGTRCGYWGRKGECLSSGWSGFQGDGCVSLVSSHIHHTYYSGVERAGVFFLSCAEGEQISFLFDCIVRGVSPSRGPFGLKPLLPEPSAKAALAETRLDQETAELEKRLSLFSHRTVSSSGSSVAGDDRSASGSSHSSDTSHSDSSVGSLLTRWAEPAPPILSETSFPSPTKMASHGEEKLPVNVVGVAIVPSEPAPSRRLEATGWQSSSDSGIATASHSSCSGSFCSYTASVDVGSPRGAHGPLLDLPWAANPARNLCTCLTTHTHEYQVPCSRPYLYDTPRSLLQSPASPEERAEQFSARQQSDEPIGEPHGPSAQSSGIPAPPRDSAPFPAARHGSSCADSRSDCQLCSAHHAASRVLTCPFCGGLKSAPISPSVTSVQRDVSGKRSASLPTGITEHPTNQEQRTQVESSTASAPTSYSPRNLSFEEKTRPQGYIDSLSDLLGHYSSGRAAMVSVLPGKTCTLEQHCLPVRPSAYEQMSSALATPPSPVAWRLGLPAPSPIYENCLQCRRGRGGCLPPRPDPTASGAASARPGWPGAAESQPAEPPEVPACLHPASGEDENPRSPVEQARTEAAYGIMENQGTDRNSESDEKSVRERLAGCGQRRSPHLGEGVGEGPRGEGATYVIVPHSLEGRRQPHYMELEQQEACTTLRGEGSTQCAQIDITATEYARGVSTQHALGRDERLQRLEQRKEGGPPQ